MGHSGKRLDGQLAWPRKGRDEFDRVLTIESSLEEKVGIKQTEKAGNI